MKISVLELVIFLWTVGLTTGSADQVIINPSDDAVVATALQPPQVENGGTLEVRGSGQGVVIFPAPVFRGSFSNAIFTLQPYGVPNWGTNVDIYGISELSGFVSPADGNAGTFLGTLQLPFYFSGDAPFDVSGFVATNNSPYIGFNFRTVAGGFNDSIGFDDFSSIEDHYGHASQLIVTAEKIILRPTIICPEPLMLECTNGSAMGTLEAGVVDTNGLPLVVVWTIDGTPSQTNEIPSGGDMTVSNVTFTANFEYGEHTVLISASNGQTLPVSCATTATVQDTTPPTVLAVSATPATIWPPNNQMVPVSLTVRAVDNCDSSPVAAIAQITCNQLPGRFAPDWQITGPLSAELRAERLGNSNRIYTIYVNVADSHGNETTATTTVTVPKSLSVLP